MSKMFGIFAVMAVLSVVMLVIGSSKKEAQSSSSKEWWYLLAMVGCFGMLSDFMSFTAVMLLFVVFSGALWLLDRCLWSRKHRKPAADKEVETVTPASAQSIEKAENQSVAAISQSTMSSNAFVSFVVGIFPIILLVFLVRSFLVEPFQIPSSSMRPGLVVGDFILVNKFTYGIRVPVLNDVMIPVHKVERGDVVVFNFPPQPKVNYIKRVIGLPGDTVSYYDKKLTINGKPVPKVADGTYEYIDENDSTRISYNQQFKETLGNKTYQTLNLESQPPVVLQLVQDFPYRENCRYDESGFTCKVPQGHYFMMGDNRDNSLDSRYWGFVDDRLLVGKAFFVWMNFRDLGRIGHSVQ